MVKQNRILWLDALKGYAILLVMLSHTLYYNNVMGILYSGFMPLFFIASGYTDNKTLTRDVVIKKSKRLLIPYFFYGLMGSLFFTIISPTSIYQGGVVHEWIGLLYARFCLYPYGKADNVFFLPIEATAPLWFLPALFVGFLIYYFFKRLKLRESLLSCLYGGAILITIMLSNLVILLPWSLDIAFLVAFFLFLGNKIGNLTYTVLRVKRIAVIIVSVCIYVMLAYYNGLVNLSVREFGIYRYWSIFAIVILGLTYFIAVSGIFCIIPKRVTKLFSWIGHLSLRLMCIQMPIFCIVGKILDLCGVSNTFLEVSVKLFVVLTVAYGMNLAISKMQRHFSVVKYL